MGSRAMGRTYSPIRSFRPKQEHVDRLAPQPYVTGSHGHPSHSHHPRSHPAPDGRAHRARGCGFAPADGGDAGDHVRRARHRPRRAADRRAAAADRHGSGQGRGAQEPRHHGQPGDSRALHRVARPRGGLPVDPRLHRRDRAAGQDPRRLYRPRRRQAGDRAARHLVDAGAARDRPFERRAIHRLSVAAEARHGGAQIHQAETHGGTLAMLLIASIVIEAAVAIVAMLVAVKGRPYLYGLALTFTIYVLYDLGRLLGWNVEKGILSVLFLLASASALFAVWGLYRDKR